MICPYVRVASLTHRLARGCAPSATYTVMSCYLYYYMGHQTNCNAPEKQFDWSSKGAQCLRTYQGWPRAALHALPAAAAKRFTPSLLPLLDSSAAHDGQAAITLAWRSSRARACLPPSRQAHVDKVVDPHVLA